MEAGTVEEVRRSWWVSVLFGLIGIAFGLITIAKPFQALVAMAWAFGILALADGIASLLAMFDKRVAVPKPWLLLYAIASIAFGIIAVGNPKATAGILFVMLAFWLIVAGVFRIIFAIRVRKEIVGEWLVALSGVLAIVLGIAFLRNPAVGLFTTAIWVGAGALVYGLMQVLAGFRFRKHAPLAA
ncbi:HdeD family acid-resistance protein [Pseudoxanthomonas sp. 10H]|uniref:HdeD family acid-resistance protein n=1 Tax=Pseudoxanthomonas sp. 10H TaxID=3242729 RepID=UPI003556A8E2